MFAPRTATAMPSRTLPAGVTGSRMRGTSNRSAAALRESDAVVVMRAEYSYGARSWWSVDVRGCTTNPG